MHITCRSSAWWWIPPGCILPSGNRHSRNKSKVDQMDLTLSDEQRMLRESADRFVTDTYNADHRKRSANDPRGFSTEIWKQFAELGWLALPIKEGHGGGGGGGLRDRRPLGRVGRG